jgi:chemotaxis protein histidine kinase CheA
VVRIDAWQENGQLVLAIADDGAGIDRDQVRRTAIDRGLLATDSPVEDSALLALLFSPGFTTAARVTRLSGRGVGLDAVRTQIRALGGDVSVQSLPARGTRFELRLPLNARPHTAYEACESSRRHTHH